MDEIVLLGICTDICADQYHIVEVFLPEVPHCGGCRLLRGVAKDRHHAALEAMKFCQIAVVE